MNKVFDVIVLGLGAHGSSAVYHLSKSGYRICGIDRFKPPHDHGSSHGESRIIRQAYHESPMYVPLVQEAYKLWYELEKVSGKQLLLKTGGIVLGNENTTVIKGAKLSAETHNIPYEYLHHNAVAQRFPALKTQADTVAVIEKDAGILFPETCIKTNLQLAAANGVELFYNEAVTSIISRNNAVEIITDKTTYQAKKLIVSAGAWINELLPELHLPLTIKRHVLFWFKNKNMQVQKFLEPGKLPVYIREYEKGEIFYGFPDLGNGIKIALHHEGETTHPHILTKYVSAAEINEMKMLIDDHFNIKAQFNYSDVCMYTNTPDEDFIIDHHPSHDNIIIASPCSGHGFKFSSLTGKILADMAMEEPSEFDITPFAIKRFLK